MAEETLLSIGLMSGTSLNGVDAALLQTDGYKIKAYGPGLHVPYPPLLRNKLYKALETDPPHDALEYELTEFHHTVTLLLLETYQILPKHVDLVGFHGQTLFHRPYEKKTYQLGNGQWLADRLNIPVVDSFRQADIAGGGQGAPLVPIFHAAIAEKLPKPLAIVNIGGVSNVTWIGPDNQLIAFDTGPGNALIDDWAFYHTGKLMDSGGALAQKGAIQNHIVHALLNHPYFSAPPPKSLDRNTFKDFIIPLTQNLSLQDGAATLTACTAWTIAHAQNYFPSPPQLWLICGGGRHNTHLLLSLKQILKSKVCTIDQIGVDGDLVEAHAFAFLAVRSLRKLPLTYPHTTGIHKPTSGGIIHYPRQRPQLRN
jgi:anhydro-N-acetylmuramic acid kinase